VTWRMANTYTQIHLHVVFAVSDRACVISSSRRERQWNHQWTRMNTNFSSPYSCALVLISG
jgi:hypothetical protein